MTSPSTLKNSDQDVAPALYPSTILVTDADALQAARALAEAAQAEAIQRDRERRLPWELVERFTASGTPPGCLIVLGAPAGCVNPAGVGDFLGDNRREMQSRILARLQAGASNGELPAGTDLKSLAAFYTTVLHGMSIQARDGATRKTLQSVAKQAMCAWDALTGSAPPSGLPPGRARA